MEQEYFFSGYCRVLDEARMVEVELEDGRLLEADCCYPDCVHSAACVIAQSIREKTGEA